MLRGTLIWRKKSGDSAFRASTKAEKQHWFRQFGSIFPSTTFVSGIDLPDGIGFSTAYSREVSAPIGHLEQAAFRQSPKTHGDATQDLTPSTTLSTVDVPKGVPERNLSLRESVGVF